MDLTHLDSPERVHDIRERIQKKSFLRKYYESVYLRYCSVIDSTPPGGIILELGSGGGFAKDFVPDLVTSDILLYDGVERVVDATAMPFANNSLRAIVMLNVFHHIPDAGAFFNECLRCLKLGGKVLIVDQHFGLISGPILKYLHHEPYDFKSAEWKFQSTGPLSSANTALAWIVFQRDRKLFERKYPSLKVKRYQTFAPLAYWLSGGLKKWSLVTGSMFPLISSFDKFLCRLHPNLGSFVEIELQKDLGI